MFAKDTEILLSMLCQKSDVARITDDVAQRFEALRRYGKLPKGRERRAQQLTMGEIAAAILGLGPVNPKWAGHGAIILCDLYPVGGQVASFFGTETLQHAVERPQ
jgi:hypothetical protein